MSNKYVQMTLLDFLLFLFAVSMISVGSVGSFANFLGYEYILVPLDQPEEFENDETE
jgi:hypothetical protein